MEYLIKLYENDVSGMIEVLKKIQSQLEDLPQQLAALRDSGDMISFHILCHKTKSSALLIGAKQLKDALSRLETNIPVTNESHDAWRKSLETITLSARHAISTIHLHLRLYDQ